MKEQEKTSADIVAERIKSMPLHSDYVPVNNMPIPLFKGILIKKTKVAERKTKTGIIMPGQTAENVISPNEGILMAVGPLCSPFSKIGLKYQYSSYVDTLFYHEGEEYYMADENHLHYVVPSDEFVSTGGYKTAKQVRQEKKVPEMFAREARIDARDENDKDKRLDKTRGKIRKVK